MITAYQSATLKTATALQTVRSLLFDQRSSIVFGPGTARELDDIIERVDAIFNAVLSQRGKEK